jgi:hypothetical protein
MKFYIKKYLNYENKASVPETITVSGTSGNYTITITWELERDDTIINVSDININPYDHCAYRLYFHDMNETRTEAVGYEDWFVRTFPTKAPQRDSIETDFERLGFLYIPFANSADTEYMWHFNCAEFIIDEGCDATFEVLETYDANLIAAEFYPTVSAKLTMLSNLPDVSLTQVTSDGVSTITAQLLDSENGNALSRPNVEIYFETTVGQLNASRVKTNANGQAIVKVNNSDGISGKVKAGFKSWSGKGEIEI